MIKISFRSENTIDDILEILFDKVTDGVEPDKWISAKIPALEFDCEDFPYDLDSFYDCYFVSNDENLPKPTDTEIYNKMTPFFNVFLGDCFQSCLYYR